MEEVVGSIPTRSTKFAMPSVYVLRSERSGRFYIGCAEDPLARLTEHNRGQTKSTRGRGPWLLVYQEQFKTSSNALARERQLKSWSPIARFKH